MFKRFIVNDFYKFRKRVCIVFSFVINEILEFNDGLNGIFFFGNYLLLIWNVI